MNHPFRHPILLAALVLALTACQGDEQAVNAAAAPSSTSAITASAITPMAKACDLVSAEQAQTVLAQAAGLMSDDPENCLWASMQSPGQITMLMLQVSEAEDPAQAQILFDALVGMAASGELVAAAGGKQATPASGKVLNDLGDAAWMSADSIDLIGARQLHVRKGQRLLSINVTGMTTGDAAAEAELALRVQALAQTAVAKL